MKVISGISIISVPTGTVKRIDDMGVFITTAVFCCFAYLWLYICLAVWSPDYIELAEAIMTILFFVILVILAFAMDKYNSYKRKKIEESKTASDAQKRKTLSKDDFYRIIGMRQKSQNGKGKNGDYTSLKNGEKDPENPGSNNKFMETDLKIGENKDGDNKVPTSLNTSLGDAKIPEDKVVEKAV